MSTSGGGLLGNGHARGPSLTPILTHELDGLVITAQEIREEPEAVAPRVRRTVGSNTRSYGVPRDNSLVSYDDDNEKLNAELQSVWSNVMDEGKTRKSPGYKRVCALLLSWGKGFEDLEVEPEVNELESTLRLIFKADVHKKYIEKSRVKASHQVAQHISNFLAHCDVESSRPHQATNTLLLVYFAGHGKPGNAAGQLALRGSQLPGEEDEETVIWNRVHGQLAFVEGSDILEIFDCCYAGSLQPVDGDVGLFEYLAACPNGQTTKAPGEESFTRALIWAFKEFQRAGRKFNANELLNKIRDEAPNFPKDQVPQLSRRQGHEQRIMLEPSRRQKRSLLGTEYLQSPIESAPTTAKSVLTLRFFFHDQPKAENIELLGGAINHAIEQNPTDLPINRIDWGGMQPWRTLGLTVRQLLGLQKAAQKWRRRAAGHSLSPSIQSVYHGEHDHHKHHHHHPHSGHSPSHHVRQEELDEVIEQEIVPLQNQLAVLRWYIKHQPRTIALNIFAFIGVAVTLSSLRRMIWSGGYRGLLKYPK